MCIYAYRYTDTYVLVCVHACAHVLPEPLGNFLVLVICILNLYFQDEIFKNIMVLWSFTD